MVYCKNIPCLSPTSKFNTVKCLLAEEALKEWETFEATATKKVVLVPVGLPENPEGKKESDDQDDQSKSKSGTYQELEEEAVGQTDITFKECIQMFLGQRIPAGSARKQNIHAQQP